MFVTGYFLGTCVMLFEKGLYQHLIYIYVYAKVRKI